MFKFSYEDSFMSKLANICDSVKELTKQNFASMMQRTLPSILTPDIVTTTGKEHQATTTHHAII